MKIAIDLTPIDGAHRFRGIGSTLINTINHMPESIKSKNNFVFFVNNNIDKDSQLFNIIDLDGVSHEFRTISSQPTIKIDLPWRFNLLVSILNRLIELYALIFGDLRIKKAQLKDVDRFIQFNPDFALPKKPRRLQVATIIYDIIPYKLEWDYLWKYKTARTHGLTRKASFRAHVRRKLYSIKIRIGLRRADILLAISKCTRDDFINELGIKKSKIKIVELGVPKPEQIDPIEHSLLRYTKTDWGYIPRNYKIEHNQYLLFIGGADRRRKLEDLVTAFNHLRAQGHDIKLVLAGDSMTGPADIATEEIQTSLNNSSYIDDIIFLGFVDDSTRSYLYKHALAYVFPSTYEGFGLPVLEAMSYGCPVISYKNKATVEVANELPLYADGYHDIFDHSLNLLENPVKGKYREKLAKHASTYSWGRTAKNIIESL